MHKYYAFGSSLLLLSLMFLSLMFQGCSNKEKEKDETGMFLFHEFNYDVVAQYPDSLVSPEEGGNYCRVAGQGLIPEKIGNLNLSVLRDSLINLAEIIVADPWMIEPALDSGMTLTKMDPNDSTICSFRRNNLSIDLITPQIIVWKDNWSFYQCGAAHGMYGTNYINFSIELNKILALQDIVRPDALKELRALIQEKLESQQVDLLVPLDEIEIPSDFRITTDGLEFIYSLYEIAPYSSGEIKVNIERYELADLLQPESPELIYGDNY